MTLNGSGTITGLSAGGLPDATITQADLATGVAGTGPAFSAYQNAAQSVTTNTWTKVNLQTEEWDTASCFNNTGSTVAGIPAYAFLPTVAGYYQVTALTATSTAVTALGAAIYKNGATIAYGVGSRPSSSVDTQAACRQVYLNGSTDYIELYIYAVGTSPTVNSLSSTTYFQASMVRAA
jgi:hypothetical protein